jgi:predicted GNAT family N-acyltransferase
MVSISVVDGGADLTDAFAVRQTVFVDEQGVDEAIEYDDNDDDATHVVAYDDGEAIGTARLRAADETTGKVERVSVLAEYRGEGVGRLLMDAVEKQARAAEFERLKLHAQTRAAGFYETVGYERYGEKFEEAGIPHVAMEKEL